MLVQRTTEFDHFHGVLYSEQDDEYTLAVKGKCGQVFGRNEGKADYEVGCEVNVWDHLSISSSQSRCYYESHKTSQNRKERF